jgi:histone H3/H4
MSTNPASKPPQAAAAPAPATATTNTKQKTVTKSAAGTTQAKKKRVRKRPPSSSSNRAPQQSSQSIMAAAKAAQTELSQAAAAAAACRSDPLWYRADASLQSIAQGSFMVSENPNGVLSNQVELVETALARNHMTRADITPQAFACLLEQGRRYALELLSDAQDYAYSANRHDINRADLHLAMEMRHDQPLAYVTLEPKLMLQANHVNRIPLPPIPTSNYTGVVLPPAPYLLTARTFDVVSGAQTAQRMVAGMPRPAVKPRATNSNNKKDTKKTPSYGAARGTQIPINIKQKEAPSSGRPEGTGAVGGPSTQQAPQPMDVDKPDAAAQPPKPAAPGGGITMASSQGSSAGLKRKAEDME